MSSTEIFQSAVAKLGPKGDELNALLEKARDREYWRGLNPALHITERVVDSWTKCS